MLNMPVKNEQRKRVGHVLLLLTLITTGFAQKGMQMSHREKATFGAGCFWCIEAVFERLEGVHSVVSGYAGGASPNPTYKEVCAGKSGHVEIAQVTFDPKKISFEQLLEVFWKAHDPTTLNRQGADIGTQYRSVIFYSDEKQKITAEISKREAAKLFDDPIVTAIEPLTRFYEAEAYHQDYYSNNANAPYCRFVIKPKLEKLHLK